MKLSDQVKQLERELQDAKDELAKHTYTKKALLVTKAGFEKYTKVDVDSRGKPLGTQLIVPIPPSFSRYRDHVGMIDRMVFELISSDSGSLLIYREV